ncbi:MAG: oligosaccharide flippase family protein [Candidatus Scalindua sp.]|nr:oligosaccharide flippase family protein [Candidatus Scalindua sp.]
MSEATSEKIIRNTLFNSAGFLWSYLLSFLLTPYIIHRIGIERFGIWAIANTAIHFFLFLDLGIGSSFVKYIAEYNTKKNYKMINEVINTGLAFSLLFCMCVFVAFLLLKSFITGLLKFSPELYSDVLFALLGVLIVFVINYAFTVFKSTLYGLQRIDIINKIFIIVSIPGTIGLILFLSSGYGLRGYVYNSIMIAVVTVISYVVCTYRILPQIVIHPRFFSTEMFKRLWSFGFKVQISGFSEFVNSQLDKVLLGHFLGVRTVAFYALGSKMALTVGTLPSVLLQAIEPATSALDAEKDAGALNRLYTRGTKYIVFLSFPLSFFVITNASPIMHFWMSGPGYDKSVLAIQILTIGYFFFLINSVGRLMARGMGVPQFEMVSALIILGLNILLSVVLIILFGFVGALIGTCISSVIGSLYFMIRFHKHIKRPILFFIKDIYLKPLVACVIAILMSLTIDFLFRSISFSPLERIGYFIYLSLKGAMFSGTYLVCIFFIRYLDEYDKNVFLSAIKMPLCKLGMIKNNSE